LNRLDRLGERFHRAARRLDGCCTRLEEMVEKRLLRIVDAELVYSATFLTLNGQFETLLGSLLEEFVCGRRGKHAGHYAVVKPRSRPIFRDVLLQGKKFADFMPFNRTQELAARYLLKGCPFSAIDKDNVRLLDEVTCIRNAIAHPTSHAITVFRARVPGVASLPKTRRNPGALLRHPYRTHPTQKYYELYVAVLRGVANNLIHAWDNANPPTFPPPP
jgi:hypothetical protein